LTLDDAQILRDLAVQHPETAPAIERAIKEIASLRITLGGKTFSADIPEPIGCPMPGACSQVREISRLRAELDVVRSERDKAVGFAISLHVEKLNLRRALGLAP
jgi:hypothetical protein